VKVLYLETIALVERLHRQCLEVVKAELERLGIRDLNSVQAMILFNIGDAELTVGELTQRGYYQGSNVSYNVKKMVEHGYLIQERSQHDRRSFHVRVSEKGLEVCQAINTLFDRHVNELTSGTASPDALREANQELSKLQHFWTLPQHYGGRMTSAA